MSPGNDRIPPPAFYINRCDRYLIQPMRNKSLQSFFHQMGYPFWPASWAARLARTEKFSAMSLRVTRLTKVPFRGIVSTSSFFPNSEIPPGAGNGWFQTVFATRLLSADLCRSKRPLKSLRLWIVIVPDFLCVNTKHAEGALIIWIHEQILHNNPEKYRQV